MRSITVVLCTYNRCETLPNALASVAAQALPAQVDWEVVVVDNNSKDRTRAVVEEFCERHPGRLRYVFEPRSGKSHALNAGIREARGEILAFIDDDVTVEPTWLEKLTTRIQQGDYIGAGGRVVPDRSFTPPRWLSVTSRYGMAPLVMFDLGLEAGALKEAPFGTNMAFARQAFQKYGGFRTDLGPQPGSEIRGEDSEFGDRLLHAGERLWYEPSAIVCHEVPLKRLQKKYFEAWWFDKGRSEIRQSGTGREATIHVSGVPLRLLRRFGVWSVRWLLTIKPTARFESKLKVWGLFGQIVECHRAAVASRMVAAVAATDDNTPGCTQA
jgi:glycosyltransferase involved in cell wall biosynthesis